jgi:secreted PhoX family phosphatase
MTLFLSRRQVAAAGAASLAFGGLARLAHAQDAKPSLAIDAIQADPYRSEVQGYGPIYRDPKGLFDLPAGFSYAIVSQAGQTMADGLITPGSCDGMGCFASGDGQVTLVRNHELRGGPDMDRGAFGKDRLLAPKLARDRIYDHDDLNLPLTGGTTTMVYDLKSRRLVSDHLSLAGTSTNCAGGITPWGSWLSCEETLQPAGVEAQADHGWVFEVPANLKGVADPLPIKAMGRFRHEAACVDPRTGIIYMTEDMGDGMGLFYRFLPNQPGKLLAGGKLQALGIKGDKDIDVRNGEAIAWKPGEWKDVVWYDLDGVENTNEDLRYRGKAKGAAWFSRGEGIHWAKSELFFACTNGGLNKFGQIMRYVPSAREGQADEASAPGRIQLYVEPTDNTVMEMCDNIAVSPWGHLFVCEDKTGGVNYLRAVTPAGKVYTVGRNPIPGGDVGATSELAGVCFSPDGSTLFVNVYNPGLTLAITGPWDSVRA